ncbi:anaerobic ribonucleoside-triphosphate reductase, partial [Vibrio cholerae]
SDFKGKNGESVFTSRANIGAVALNLPMIWKESDGKNFYEDLDYYLEMIRNLHKKRYDTLAKTKCSSNPMAFC